MTEPQPVMAQAEQDQLTRQVGRSLLTVAGADWQQVRAEYRAAGRHIEVDVFVKGPDGVERPVRPPQEVVDGLGRLRQGMYRPGRGTWLSALYVLDPPSAFSAEFEPDVEPRWRRVPPPIGFADELRFFPRGDEHIPDWLRQRAGLPPAPGTQEAEQANAPAGSGGVVPTGGPATPDGAPTPSGQPAASGQPNPAGQPTPGGPPPGGQPSQGGPVPSGQPAPSWQPAQGGQPTPGGPPPGGQPMPFGGPQPPASPPHGFAAQPTPPGGFTPPASTPPAGFTPPASAPRAGFAGPQEGSPQEAGPQAAGSHNPAQPAPPGIPAGPFTEPHN